MTTIALFASGSGSNTENIIQYFAGRPDVRFLVLCNKPEAVVLQRAARLQVPAVVFNRQDFYGSATVLGELVARSVDLIVLAGFLWLVPANLVKAYPHKIINIHPSLLPKFGGQGMYGNKVHQAVLAAGEAESGITIHYVDEQYDEGRIILQARCPVLPHDTADSLAARIHALEYAHYPLVIQQLIE